MILFEVGNEKIWLDKYNKMIINNNNKYFEFCENIQRCFINGEKDLVKINNSNFKSKEILFLDFSTINIIVENLINNEYIVSNYMTCKIAKFIEKDYYQEEINKVVEKLFETLYVNVNYKEEVDIIKLIKSNTDCSKVNMKELISFVEYILNNSEFKFILILFDRKIINELKIDFSRIEKIDNDNIVYLEMLNKDSEIKDEDNLIWVNDIITQLTFKDVKEIIEIEEILGYEEKLKKILFYILKGEDVQMIREELENIETISKILNKKLGLNYNNESAAEIKGLFK